MDSGVLEACKDFFAKLDIEIRELSTEDQMQNGEKVVEVDYKYLNKVFTTKPLHYREVLRTKDVRDPEGIRKRFSGDVFVLDLNYHGWPQSSGESDLDQLVINDMVREGDDAFRKFLLSLANNSQTGFIQKMTRDGQPGQYYHNLMNNNHWHDLVLLIKAAFEVRGRPSHNDFIKPLIFKWIDGKRAHMGLRPYNRDYKMISDLFHNAQSFKMDPKNEKLTELLEYKKQIILQGPPGTGKTKLARELAERIIGPVFTRENPASVSDEMIIETLTGVSNIQSIAGNATYKIISVDGVAKHVTLERSNGSRDVTKFEKIRRFYQEQSFLGILAGNDDRRAAALAGYVNDHLEVPSIKTSVFSSDQYELIQFHPSYTYEDFVRGIVSSPSEDNKGIIYKAENKTLAAFARRAFDNWVASADPRAFGRGNWLKDTVDQFLLYLNSRLDEEEGRLMLTGKAYITKVSADSIRYNADAWDVDGGVPIIDIGRMFEGHVRVRNDVVKLSTLTKTAKHLPTYWFKVYELFLKFLADNELSPDHAVQYQAAKNYVLIIDEINRANLSSVLGELIYALEYRGESVNSIYELDGEKSIVLPPNLYIIGTMNTADRSIGYIDYAIRRRFAFVDVPSRELTELNDDFDSKLFNRVKNLFSEAYLAPDFKAKDVQLGHSYFIRQYKKNSKGEKTGYPHPFELRVEFEILPLLREYVSDGVLNEKAAEEINKISMDYLGK